MATKTEQTKRFANKEIFPKLSGIAKYHIRYTLMLSAVPLICGSLLLMLVSMFSKLNLYFLEANGLLLDEQVRDAYYKQVEIEMFSVLGYLGFQVLVTAIVSLLVMRWATSPFSVAQKTVQRALDNPDTLKPASHWLSESPMFDRMIWLFSLRVKSGGPNQIKEPVHFGMNLPFLAKFTLSFGILSVCTGYVLSIIMDSVYKRIIDLALQLLRTNRVSSHYFTAQQDMLQDANTFTTGLAMVCYIFLGWQISRYMATMLFVFSRAMHEDKFPISLRSTDLYLGLAETMNKARNKIG